MTDVVASVVIAARNEEKNLLTLLPRLSEQGSSAGFEIVVVANDCSDGSADVARAAGAVVVETSRPGKAGALREGDARAAVFPRIYLDADVGVSAAALRDLAGAVQSPGILAAAPTPIIDTTGSAGSVRRFLRVHERLMEGRRGLAGAGIYVLTEEGHDRAFPLPDVVADDLYVNSCFAPRERTITSTRVRIKAPRTTAQHLRRRARVRKANRELSRVVPNRRDRIRLIQVVALVRAGDLSAADTAAYALLTIVEVALSWTRSPRGWRRPTAGEPVGVVHGRP